MQNIYFFHRIRRRPLKNLYAITFKGASEACRLQDSCFWDKAPALVAVLTFVQQSSLCAARLALHIGSAAIREFASNNKNVSIHSSEAVKHFLTLLHWFIWSLLLDFVLCFFILNFAYSCTYFTVLSQFLMDQAAPYEKSIKLK